MGSSSSIQQNTSNSQKIIKLQNTEQNNREENNTEENNREQNKEQNIDITENIFFFINNQYDIGETFFDNFI